MAFATRSEQTKTSKADVWMKDPTSLRARRRLPLLPMNSVEDGRKDMSSLRKFRSLPRMSDDLLGGPKEASTSSGMMLDWLRPFPKLRCFCLMFLARVFTLSMLSTENRACGVPLLSAKGAASRSETSCGNDNIHKKDKRHAVAPQGG